MMYWNNHMTSGGWIISTLATVIVLMLVVAALVWISRERRDRRDTGPTGASSALERWPVDNGGGEVDELAVGGA